MNYQIKELETEIMYDDVYETKEQAQKVIAEYEKEDGEERKITYIVIEV